MDGSRILAQNHNLQGRSGEFYWRYEVDKKSMNKYFEKVLNVTTQHPYIEGAQVVQVPVIRLIKMKMSDQRYN